MARPLCIESPCAVYHVTSRGDRREAIFVDDEDRRAMLAVVKQAMARFDAKALADCLMGNHYHLVLQTRQANLSRLMRHLNGVTTQSFNRRHGKEGHLFQGRFKAILVDREELGLSVSRVSRLIARAEAAALSGGRRKSGSASRHYWGQVSNHFGADARFLISRELRHLTRRSPRTHVRGQRLSMMDACLSTFWLRTCVRSPSRLAAVASRRGDAL